MGVVGNQSYASIPSLCKNAFSMFTCESCCIFGPVWPKQQGYGTLCVADFIPRSFDAARYRGAWTGNGQEGTTNSKGHQEFFI